LGRAKRRRSAKRQVVPVGERVTRDRHKGEGGDQIQVAEANRERYFELACIALLLVFGIYLSVIYFGHQVVPNSDFPGFVRVGQSLLSFELPESFKRPPVVGILQIGLGQVVGGRYPELTGGWLLNAILYPLSILLLYLVGKRIVGRWAVWFALIAGINPWSISMLVQPIVETTLVFFILLTVYLIFLRSKWCYVAGAMASMVRYEGAALIVAAFVLDMIESKTTRQRVYALVRSFLAGIPLMLWVLGTIMGAKTGEGGGGGGIGQVDYLRNYGQGRVVFGEYFGFLWDVTFGPLLVTVGEQGGRIVSTEVLGGAFGRISGGMVFLVGVIYGIVKRNWNVLVLLVFLLMYFLAHGMRDSTRDRYCIPISWLTLLFCWYGLQSVWKGLVGFANPPGWVKRLLQVLLIIIGGVWIILLVPGTGELAKYFRTSSGVPYMGCGVLGLILVFHIILYKGRYLIAVLAVSVLVGVMVFSNQFELSPRVGSGKVDEEFKLLADWYLDHAGPDEKLATTLPSILSLFAPEHSKKIIQIGNIKGSNSQEFVEGCYRRGITYVCWDSRVGLTSPSYKYYRQWGIDRIKALGGGEDIGPWEFMEQIKSPQTGRYINIFRLGKGG